MSDKPEAAVEPAADAGDHEAFLQAVVETANRWVRSRGPVFPITISLRIGRYGGSPCPEVVDLWQGELGREQVLELIPEVQGFVDIWTSWPNVAPPVRREAPPDDF